DALLGGASLGDIGLHFPDNDEYYKGIDSKILLSKTCQKIREAGFEVENVDCTILAQAPRLRPYIELMRATLSQVMQIPTEDVSIKATTTEHLGFVGRQEGVAVYCVALLSK
ncbi:MAG: 2-C-methyl-D-erythritol 2,4-cyclodiphosphate synthase, partial [Mucinivorans sp.]